MGTDIREDIMGNSRKWPVIIAYINADGKAIRVTDIHHQPLDNDDYNDGKGRRIDKNAVLACENYCRWRLRNGQWVCV